MGFNSRDNLPNARAISRHGSVAGGIVIGVAVACLWSLLQTASLVNDSQAVHEARVQLGDVACEISVKSVDISFENGFFHRHSFVRVQAEVHRPEDSQLLIQALSSPRLRVEAITIKSSVRSIDDSAMLEVAAWPYVREISLNASSISDKSIEALSRMKSLERIRIGFAPNLSEASLIAIFGCKSLKSLGLLGNPWLPDAVARVPTLTQLRDMRIEFIGGDKSVCEWIAKHKGLERLELHGPFSFFELSPCLTIPSLTHLRLGLASDDSLDQGFAAFEFNSPHLKSLSLLHCTIRKNAIDLALFPELEELYLDSTDTSCVRALGNRNRKLRRIAIRHSHVSANELSRMRLGSVASLEYVDLCGNKPMRPGDVVGYTWGAKVKLFRFCEGDFLGGQEINELKQALPDKEIVLEEGRWAPILEW